MGKAYSKNWAESKRIQGNEEYSKGEYVKAIKSYSIAIFLSPNETAYYGNRILCYMMLKEYKNALNDLYCTLKINPKYEKGYIRLVKCHLAIGDIAGTEYAIKYYENFIPESSYKNVILGYGRQLKILKNLKISSQTHFYNKNYDNCLTDLEKSLNISPECLLLKYQKVECLILLNKLDESKEIIEKSLKVLTPNSIEVLYLSVLYFFHIGDISKCIALCEGNFISMKDHMKINALYNEAKLINHKNKQATKFVENGDYNQAIIIYNEAIEYQTLSRSVQSKLYFNRALVYFKMKSFFRGIADCEEALSISPKPKVVQLQPKHLKVLYLSAQYHFDLNFMEKCMKFCEYALDSSISRELRELLKKTKFEIHKRNERKKQEEEAKRRKEEERKREEERIREEKRKCEENRRREEEKKKEEEMRRNTERRKEKERREEEERKQEEARWKEQRRREEAERRQKEEERRRHEERKRQEKRRKYWEEQQKKNEEKRKRQQEQNQKEDRKWEEEQRKQEEQRQQQRQREQEQQKQRKQQKQQQKNHQEDSKNNRSNTNNNSRNFVKDTKGYYKTMGLNTNATPEEIQFAYKSLAKKHHPDKHPNSPAKEKNQEIFKRITEAYRILSDTVKKYDYDRS